MVVEDLRGLPHKSDGVSIGAVGEVEASNPVIGCRQTDPGGRIFRGLFGGVAEVTFGETVMASVEVFDPFKKIAFDPIKLGVSDPDGLNPTAAVAVGLALRRQGDR